MLSIRELSRIALRSIRATGLCSALLADVLIPTLKIWNQTTGASQNRTG
jgi:hypothetical protein